MAITPMIKNHIKKKVSLEFIVEQVVAMFNVSVISWKVTSFFKLEFSWDTIKIANIFR